MFAEKVLDMAGRRWSIERRLTPWRLVLRPDALLTGHYPARRLTPAPVTRRRLRGPSRASRGEKAVQGVMAVLDLPGAVLRAVSVGVLFACATPFAAGELVVRAVAGLGLGLLRVAGLARHRVDVVARTGHLLHSETVLLVRGGRRARRLVRELCAERVAATRPFRPGFVPAGVTVRTHRSAWQPSSEWVISP